MAYFDKLTLAIAATSLGESLMGTIFRFYYIKVFLELYGLEQRYLNIAQILFMIWNAVNDPLFGYIQDVGCGRRSQWLMDRRKVILYMGPVFAVSFLVFWMPWSGSRGHWLIGLHLTVSLFLYDALFSLVLSAHCALFTELSTKHFSRVRVVIYMEIAQVIGSLVIFPVDKLSQNLQKFSIFQYICVAAAILGALCFLYTGIFGPREVAQIKDFLELTENGTTQNNNDQQKTDRISSKCEMSEKKTMLPKRLKIGFVYCWQVLRERDFLCVVMANFFRIMRVVAAANFTAIFVEALVSSQGILPLKSTALSLFYQATQTLPSIIFIFLWPVLQKVGPWILQISLSGLSLINCFVMIMVGRKNYTWLAVYILLENLFSRIAYPGVYNIFFPDVIDEDMKRHSRKSPISTLVFTLNALLTKPAISVAPIIIVFFLNRSNYALYNRIKHIHFLHSTNATSANATQLLLIKSKSIGTVSSILMTEEAPTAVKMTDSEISDLQDIMFSMACLFPLFCTLVEALCLLPYRLKFHHRRDHLNLNEQRQSIT